VACIAALRGLNVASETASTWLVSSMSRASVDCSLYMYSFQALSSSSVASVLSVESERSRSVLAVESRSRSLSSAEHSRSIYSNSNSNGDNNVALVGGVVGGVLGAAVICLVGIILLKRKRGAAASSSAGQQPFHGQQSSSQPITPASPTFSTNSNYISTPPVTYAAYPGWYPQQPPVLMMPEGAGPPVAGQTSTASQQSA